MKLPLTGGCVCGAVRYEVASEPLAMFNCHCRTCQMVTGGPYTPVVLIRTKSFKLTNGSLRYSLTDNIKGGKHKRGFCAECGSRVTGGETEQPRAWMAVTASSLDDSSFFKPQFDIFASHAQVWDRLDPSIPKYTDYPPPK